jgi:hypothetical protein
MRIRSRLFQPKPHHYSAFGFQKSQNPMRKLVGRLSGFRHFFKIFIYKLGGIPPRYILLNCLLKKFWFFDQISVAKSSRKTANTLFFWNSRTTFCRWLYRDIIRVMVLLLKILKFLPHRRKSMGITLAGYKSFQSFEKYARANGQALKLIRW